MIGTRELIFFLLTSFINSLSLLSNQPFNLTTAAGTTIKQVSSNSTGHLYVLLSDSSISIYSPTFQFIKKYPNPVSYSPDTAESFSIFETKDMYVPGSVNKLIYSS